MGRSTGQTSAAPRLRDGVAFCLGVFLAARIVLSLVGVLGVGAIPEDPYYLHLALGAAEHRPTPGWQNAIDGTDRWDALWFERIATSGYGAGDATAAFFPAYPLAVGAVTRVTRLSATLAGLLVSNGAFLGALIVLYALTTLEHSVALAKRTVILTAFLPTSFFFLAPYSESLFLLFTVLTFWLARRDRWLAAGIAGAFAAATRSIGLVLLPALAIEAFSRRSDRRDLLRRLGAAVLVAAGPLAYGASWLLMNGNAFEPFAAQTRWHRTLEVPVVTLGRGFSLAIEGVGAPRGIYWTVDFLFAAAALLILGTGWRKLRGSYLAFAGLSLLVPLCYPFPPRPLLSFPRFVIVVFPLYWLIASMARTRAAFALTVAAGFAGSVALSVAFMNWRYLF